METLWYWLIAVMIALYVLLDGFDLGAGIIHLRVARTDAERQQVIGSIGPVWGANEVWLLAAAGTLYFVFPALYAGGFSGFYLPLVIVLWLLIVRGISIEFRGHVESPVWAPLWDVLFSFSSALLAIFYGAALGNVVRGVPLDAQGYFFEPLWTNFRVGTDNGILDWYTLLVGLTAYLALAMHGALWVAARTQGPVHDRARSAAKGAWLGVLVFSLVISWVTFSVQPHVLESFRQRPYGWVLPLIAIGGLVDVRWLLRGQESSRSGAVFIASCVYLLGILASVVFGVYPYVLPSSTDPAFALTIRNASAAPYGLKVGLVWWVIGMALATGYFAFVYRLAFRRTAHASKSDTHYNRENRDSTTKINSA
jgi:cytochrome d ubiquinol oxidase subunit II